MVFFVIIASSSFSLKEKVREKISCWHSRHRKPITSELKTNNLKKKMTKRVCAAQGASVTLKRQKCQTLWQEKAEPGAHRGKGL